MAEDIKFKLLSIIKENAELVKDINISQYDEKLEDFGVNSISFIKMVVAIESEYGFEFDDEDLDFTKINTVNKLVEYIENKLSECAIGT